MVFTPTNNIINDGLVLYLDAGIKGSYSGSGSTWNDLASNNNGNLVNGATFAPVRGGSIALDGVDGYVNCGDFDVANITVEVWCRLENFFSVIAAKRDESNYAWDLSCSSTNLILFGPNDNSFRAISGTAIPLNTWTQCGGTFDGTTTKVFINGVVEGSTPYVGSIASNAVNVTIGRRSFNPHVSGDFVQGNIAIARIYNRGISEAEIKKNFEAQRNRFGI